MEENENIEKVKGWYKIFKEEIKELKDTKAYLANCNIDWLIKEVEKLQTEIKKVEKS